MAYNKSERKPMRKKVYVKDVSILAIGRANLFSTYLNHQRESSIKKSSARGRLKGVTGWP